MMGRTPAPRVCFTLLSAALRRPRRLSGRKLLSVATLRYFNCRVPVTRAVFIVEGGTTAQKFTITASGAISNTRVAIYRSTSILTQITSAISISGAGSWSSSDIAIHRVTTPSISLTPSRFVGGIIEVQSVVTNSVKVPFPMDEGASFLLRDSTLSTAGLVLSGELSGASRCHIENNAITSSSGDAIFISGNVTESSVVSIVGNSLRCVASATAHGIEWDSMVNESIAIIARNNALRGSFCILGDFIGSNTLLHMSGNSVNPSDLAVSYIFYLPTWAAGARFYHY